MAITALNTLKGWFVTAAKPLQTHFHAWMDSFWHKEESIPISSVDGLSEAINERPNLTQVQQLLAEAAPKFVGSTDSDFSLTFNSNGILRDARFHAEAPGSFTLRINEDSNTDLPFVLGTTYPVSHSINIPLYPGAKIEILNPTTNIFFTFYTV